MLHDLHIHMIMDGINYRNAVDRHREGPDEGWIHQLFREYQKQNIRFLRDGGDAGGVSLWAKRIAPQYGIDYRSPLYAIHKKGHYGRIVGFGFENLKEYADMVRHVKRNGGDFIKIMISGLVDFSRVHTLTEEGLKAHEISEMIHIAHEEGMAVMAHANGAANVKAALAGGVDSIEHGAYIDDECIRLLAEGRTVWVPTLSPVCNIIGSSRYDDGVLREIADIHGENIRKAVSAGAMVGLGSDAGSWKVPHKSAASDEYRCLGNIIPDRSVLDQMLKASEERIRDTFRNPAVIAEA